MYWHAEDNAPGAPFKVRTLANEARFQKIEHLHEQKAWSNILSRVKHLAHVWHSIHSFKTLGTLRTLSACCRAFSIRCLEKQLAFLKGGLQVLLKSRQFPGYAAVNDLTPHFDHQATDE